MSFKENVNAKYQVIIAMPFLDKLKAEFDRKDSSLLFNQWMLQTFGIRIIYSNEGHLTETYEVVDEKKYLFFVLKYL